MLGGRDAVVRLVDRDDGVSKSGRQDAREELGSGNKVSIENYFVGR